MILEHIVFDWRDALDITLVGVLLYQVIQLLRGTRALAVLSGLGVLTALYFMSRSMGLYTLSWLLQHIFGSLFILIVVIFQNDIRQALGEVVCGWGRSSCSSAACSWGTWSSGRA